MLAVARTLVKADRTGSWDMHLYIVRRNLQVSSNIRCCRSFQLLEIGLPLPVRYDSAAYDELTDSGWDLGCVVIEQTIMRTLKYV